MILSKESVSNGCKKDEKASVEFFREESGWSFFFTLLVLVDKIWQPQMLNFSLMLAGFYLSHSGHH